MKPEIKEALYKSRFLIACLFFSIIGYVLANNIYFIILFFCFIVYSGHTIAGRLDAAEEQAEKNKEDDSDNGTTNVFFSKDTDIEQ